MKVRVLGSAAGGGFPQWNCGCPNCTEARKGDGDAKPRTQETVAVSADGDTWFLLNASPEIRAQIEATPDLHPRAKRHSPIAGVVLTNGDLDHCLGLLSLREWQALRLFATSPVHDGLVEGNVVMRTLERFDGQLRWEPLALDRSVTLLTPDGREAGLTLQPIAAPGKLPLHLERDTEPSDEDNIGLLIRESATGATLAYLPGVAHATAAVERAIRGADLVFFDGTFWSDDELIKLELADKRAEEMAHWPLGGGKGSLAWLSEFTDARRVLIHINNTNPILIDGSAEAKKVRAAGVEIAHDGLEITL